jgi:hypothetical protein
MTQSLHNSHFLRGTSGGWLTALFRVRQVADSARSAASRRGYGERDLRVVSPEQRPALSAISLFGSATNVKRSTLAGALSTLLVGHGVPEERAARYEAAVVSGAILLALRPRSAEDAAWLEAEWRGLGAELVYR